MHTGSVTINDCTTVVSSVDTLLPYVRPVNRCYQPTSCVSYPATSQKCRTWKVLVQALNKSTHLQASCSSLWEQMILRFTLISHSNMSCITDFLAYGFRKDVIALKNQLRGPSGLYIASPTPSFHYPELTLSKQQGQSFINLLIQQYLFLNWEYHTVANISDHSFIRRHIKESYMILQKV